MQAVLGKIERDRLRKLYKHSSGRDHQLFQVVLLLNEGWSQSKIAQVLKLDIDTVSGYLSEYFNSKKPTLKKRLATYQLQPEQEAELVAYIEQNPTIVVRNIIEYIKQNYKDVWTGTAVYLFLKTHNFSRRSQQILDREVVTKTGQRKPIYYSVCGWFRDKSTKSDNGISDVTSANKS